MDWVIDHNRTGSPPDSGFMMDRWRVQPGLRTIDDGSTRVQLEPRVMDLLIRLCAAKGSVVTRQRLLDDVWHETVVNEEALSRAVSELRKALGDNPRNPRYVQTVHKTGYRLIGNISALPAKSQTTLRWVAGTVASIALIWFIVRPGGDPPLVADLASTVLTAYPGIETDIATDSIGDRIVFSWDGDGDTDLYIRRAADLGPPTRLTHSPAVEYFPTFSPDGNEVAWIETSDQSSAVWTVSVRGGAPVKLLELPDWTHGLNWLPDGRSLVVALPDRGVRRLVSYPIDGSPPKPLTSPDPTVRGDYRPIVSPDGRYIAFARLGIRDMQLWVLDLNTLKERAVSPLHTTIRGHDFSDDSQSLAYATARAGKAGVWVTSVVGDASRWLPLVGVEVHNPIFLANRQLAYQSVSRRQNLWTVPIIGQDATTDSQRLGMHSTRREFAPMLSPNQQNLAFITTRTGTSVLAVGPIDGSAVRTFTRLPFEPTSQPVWSPDGRWLAAAFWHDGRSVPYRVEVATGKFHPIERGDSVGGFEADAIPVGYSTDGRELALRVRDENQWDLWLVAPESPTGPVRLTRDGGYLASALDSERWLLTRRGDDAFYLATPSEDGFDLRLIGSISGRDDKPWRLAGNTIFAMVFADDRFQLMTVSIDNGAVSSIDPPEGFGNADPFDISADASTLFFSRTEAVESDVMLVDLGADTH